MENKELLFRYLLGDLPWDERKRVQQDAATNTALSEDLQEAESDLIDAYVCQRLSEMQYNQFETYFLNSEDKRQRVEMAQILLSPAVRRMAPATEFQEDAFEQDGFEEDEFERLDPGRQAVQVKRTSSAWSWLVFVSPRFAWAMATLALAIVGTAIVVQNLRLRSQLERSTSAEATFKNQIGELKNQIAELQRPTTITTGHEASSPKGEISLLLSPGQQRSGEEGNGPALLKLPPLPEVGLILQLEQDRYPQYEVSITTADGKQIWRKKSLTSQSGQRGEPMIVAHLPSDLLVPGDYFIKVSARTSGGEPRSVDAYAFTVTR